MSPEGIRVVMEREYMSQTDMMRTLEALVSTVEGLKQSLNWRLPLTVTAIMVCLTVVVALPAALLD